MRCGCCKEDHATAMEVRGCYDEAAYQADSAAAWYCDHDVPNGCHECARSRSVQAALDAMTDEERADFLYDGGTFETYFAQGGPAWQKEEMERMGLSR